MLALWLNLSRPPVAQHQIEIGFVELAIAELRTMEPADWISVSRCPSGRALGASFMLCCVFLNRPDPGTPGLLEVCLDALAAYEQAGANEDTGACQIYCIAQVLYCSRAFTFSDANAAAIRDAAPSIRFLLDHPQNLASDVGVTSGLAAGFTAAEVFGRDEDSTTMQLRQDDIDDFVRLFERQMTGEFFGGVMPINPMWSDYLLHLSVSDHHKPLILANPGAIPLLISGLFLDPDHPRGLRAKEILHEAAAPTPLEVQAVYQRNWTELLEQLALFGPGKEALLCDEAAMAALEAVVELGMTEEAKQHARGALIALRGVAEHEEVVPNHVMLSYCWEDQSTIVRINESLKRRRYSTWLDVRPRYFLDSFACARVAS